MKIEDMTLDELRKWHQDWHAGYIWDCPHCAEQWKRLKKLEMEPGTNEKSNSD